MILAPVDDDVPLTLSCTGPRTIDARLQELVRSRTGEQRPLTAGLELGKGRVHQG